MEQAWQQIINETLSGRASAQMVFYRRYAPKLYPSCRRMMGSAELAEEVLQDSFLKIFTHLTHFDTEPQLMAWMCRIVQRTAIDALRCAPFVWEPIDNSILEEAEEEEVDQSIVCRQVEQVKQAVDHLPPGYRTVLSLHLFEGYTLEEVAQMLQLKPASARSQYLRAKAKLLTLISHLKNSPIMALIATLYLV